MIMTDVHKNKGYQKMPFGRKKIISGPNSSRRKNVHLQKQVKKANRRQG